MKYRSKIVLLQKTLGNQSNLETKKWFENYLKGAIKYRGIKTPQVLKIVQKWHNENNLDQLTLEAQLGVATNLIRQDYAEDKFAGILYIQKYLNHKLDFCVLAGEFEKLFEEACFRDWSTTDWFNVRVLSPLIKLHGNKAMKRFTSWYKSKNIWQRRSSIFSLRACVNSDEYFQIINRQVTRLVKSEERFIQTGIGWVIADLAKSNPKEADKIVQRHLKNLSLEVVRRHTKNLARHKQYVEQKKSQK